jgi:hypothetical protein
MLSDTEFLHACFPNSNVPAGTPRAGEVHDLYVQLRDASGNRIASNYGAPGDLAIACNGDPWAPTGAAVARFQNIPNYNKFCSTGYPQFIDHTDGVWHYRVQVCAAAPAVRAMALYMRPRVACRCLLPCGRRPPAWHAP